MTEQEGMTLVEVLFVLMLISGLAAASGWALNMGLKQQRRNEARQLANRIGGVARSYWLSNEAWPQSVATLQEAGLIKRDISEGKQNVTLEPDESSMTVRVTKMDGVELEEPATAIFRVPIDPRKLDSAESLNEGQFGIIELKNYSQAGTIFGIAELQNNVEGVEVWRGISQGQFLLVNSTKHKSSCPLEYRWGEVREVLYGPVNKKGEVYIRGYYHKPGELDNPIVPGTDKWDEGGYSALCQHLGAVAHGLNTPGVPPNTERVPPLDESMIWTRDDFEEAHDKELSPPDSNRLYPHVSPDQVGRRVLIDESKPMILRRLVDQ